jgi:hypothetical protein
MADKISTDSRKKRRGTDSPRRFISLRQLIDAENNAKSEHSKTQTKDKNTWEKASIVTTAIATIFIAGAGIATGVVGYYQWRALHDTDEATHDLARTALKQAEATGNQVGVMRRQLDVMETDKRPWIKVNVAAIKPIVFTEWNGSKGLNVPSRMS